MPAFRTNRSSVAGCRNRFLFNRNGTRRFYRCSNHDWHSSRNTTEHTAVAIGTGRHACTIAVKNIVVISARQARTRKSNAVLNTENGR